ncbi:hypothetical protein [Streptomyces sp. MP131-18]|uniref:hypothetical protein n=1 Tax=Streptomyces sp. MP131-18 TaxID=1857892 RepID=UPI00097BC354|nr:hypothetical protein [Streptomyces sp. MP131-18]ONK09433.1 hypothetical protein STBA_01330 [Streptomyces sp. MP131-18]
MDLGDIGTDPLTWGRLGRILRVQPATSASALAWAKSRERGVYPIDIELAAGAFDALAMANWQRSKKGSNAGSAPKPVARPSRVEALRGHAREQLIDRGRALLRRQRPRPPRR